MNFFQIDFIFLKDTGNICIESVDVIGTTRYIIISYNFEESHCVLFFRHPPLSDHFGLSSTFRIK